MSCPACQCEEAAPAEELSHYALCLNPRCGNRYPRSLCSEDVQRELDQIKPRLQPAGYVEGRHCTWDGMDPRLRGNPFRNRE